MRKVRNAWGWGWFDCLAQDVVYAVRGFRLSPGFSSVVILTLALGMGAATMMFTVINAVLLRPLPYHNSDRMVWVWSVRPGSTVREHVSNPDFLDWRAQSKTLESWVAWSGYETVLTGEGPAQKVQGALFMGNLFTLLGVPPMLGNIASAETIDPAEPNVVLSHSFWQRNFNSDPAIIGRRIALNGLSYTVSAVMPNGFRFSVASKPNVDLWIPLVRFNPFLEKKRDARLSEVIARLRPKATLQQAQAEMGAIAAQLSRTYPATNQDVGVQLVSGLDEVTGSVSRALFALFAAVGSLLLIACINVANLHLVRAAARQREISMRAALGAGRRRIAIQLAVEGLIIAAAAGAVGFLIADLGLRAVVAHIPATLPRADEIHLNGEVLAFSFLTVIATGLLFSLAPIWHALHIDVSRALQESRQTVAGGNVFKRVSRIVTAAEMALATLLLIGACLFIKTFWHLQQPEPGWNPQNVLTFNIDLPSGKYPRPLPVFQELQRRLMGIPGVIAASTGMQLPDRGGPVLNEAPFVDVEGRPTPPNERQRASIIAIQPGYFRALGIPLLRGRDFMDADMTGKAHVTIINESFARTYFRNEDPIGQHLKFESWTLIEPRTQEVIGVARDLKHNGAETAEPVAYFPIVELPRWGSSIVVKTAGNPLGFVAAVRSAVASMDPNQPIDDVELLDQRLSASIDRERFTAFLIGVFSTLGVILAAVGLYGVISYIVVQRRQEIAIRIALGADTGDILQVTFREAMLMTSVGIVAGLSGALAQTRLIQGLLFGVTPTDPYTFGGVALFLVLIALSAWLIPARRATKIDPVVVLRQ
jgi:predicted permease